MTGERPSFSMRCVECGLLLSEAEEAEGLTCTDCRRGATGVPKEGRRA